MDFNSNTNPGVQQNQQFQMTGQQQFNSGNSNIAQNLMAPPPQYMMMGGVGQGFNPGYQFQTQTTENQQTQDPSGDKTAESSQAQNSQQANVVGQKGGVFPNGPNHPIPNMSTMPGPFGFPPQMMPQPNIITAAPTVLPHAPIPNLMPNPPMINPHLMNPPLINMNMMNSKTKMGPVMGYPMKPLIDTLLNPVVVKVPEKEEEPKMTNVVYVGGLTTDTSNEFVINMLQKCGKTMNFKRHTDPSSGMLATFAFCDFESPGGAYYAIECLADQDYGENKLKVSCNSRVKVQIDDWKEGKVAEMLHKNPDKTREEVLQEMEEYKKKLKKEFIELINMRFKTRAEEKEKEKGEEGEEEEEETPRSSHKELKEKVKEKEESTGLTKDYTMHRKESDRNFKLRQKKRNYENKYKDELIKWEQDEERYFRKIKALFEVSQSKREKLIQEDLKGLSKPNLKNREKEKEEDRKDEQEEYDENKSKKISLKLSTSTQGQKEGKMERQILSSGAEGVKESEDKGGGEEHLKKKKKREDEGQQGTPLSNNRDRVVTLFASEEEEVKKPKLSEEEIWKMVPESNILDYDLDWEVLFSTNLSILIEPWIRRCILEYMGDEESLVNDVLEFIFSRLKERPKPQEILFDVEQFLDEESQGFVTQLWRLLVFHEIRLKNQ